MLEQGALPLRKLRDDQVETLLASDPALAHALVTLNEELARHSLVMALFRRPSMNAEYKHRFRIKSVEAGGCVNGSKHGPPTHGKLCDACYAANLANVRARRAAAKGVTPKRP